MPARSKRRAKGGAHGGRGAGMEELRRSRPRPAADKGDAPRSGGRPEPATATTILERFQTDNVVVIAMTFVVGLLGFSSSIGSAVLMATSPNGSLPIETLAVDALTAVLGLAFMALSVRNFRQVQQKRRR